MMRSLLPLLCLVACGIVHAGDENPGALPKAPVLLVDADVYPASGPMIPRGQVLFDKGKILAVGTTVDAPPAARRISLSRKRVYPGLIDSSTQLGLVEIEAVKPTRDRSEAGQVNPNLRAEVAVNPDSELIPVARANGILAVVTAPEGGVISGSSAMIYLDGWTWEDMTVRAPLAVCLNWPSMVPHRGWRNPTPERDQARQRDEAVKQIEQTFDDARAYRTARQAPAATQPFDARWEAMIPLLDGKIPLLVRADEVQQIQAAVAFARRQKLRLVIAGGADAARCADLLKRDDVPVIITGVHRLPDRRWEGYDEPFALARQLHEAGVRFAIAGNRWASLVRNLPYHAATAVAFGLPPEEGLRAMTLYPAEIFGVADRLGSLEPGKDATLFVTDGDVFEATTQVTAAWIAGRPVDLSSRHTRLWRKYQEKYRRQGHEDPTGGSPE